MSQNHYNYNHYNTLEQVIFMWNNFMNFVEFFEANSVSIQFQILKLYGHYSIGNVWIVNFAKIKSVLYVLTFLHTLQIGVL